MKRNIGILAHVDAGKTTVTEQLLFHAGATRTVGSVDKGTSTTDTMAVERDRGISVRLATAALTWNKTLINLIDTPGHVDFCVEVERSLRALDCAVLVISAVEGVQAHTETLFRSLQALNIPTLLFVNKIDRVGADLGRVVAEIRKDLTDDVLVLQAADDQAEAQARPGLTWSEGAFQDHRQTPMINSLFDILVERDEALLARYLDDHEPTFAELDEILKTEVSAGRLYPVLCGVAKNGLGIPFLLDAIVSYLPEPGGNPDSPLSGVVFKIEHDKTLGKLASVRLFDGRLRPRDLIVNATRDVEQKVTQIKKNYSGRLEDLSVLDAGDIGVICGLDQAQVGDVLGTGEGLGDVATLSAPLLTVQVLPGENQDFTRLAQALGELAAEDPLLDLQWLQDQRELHIKITGWIQIEVLEAVLRDRFNVAATFSEPTIIYKETLCGTGHGFERYWMPKPCWAIVKFLMEPGPTGSGVVYVSNIGVNDVAARFQKEIQRSIAGALKQGIKGWEVTDVKITLVEGEDHNVHSRAGDFAIATAMAMMNGQVEIGTTFLEPILAFRITAACELLGGITSDLSVMRAVFEAPQMQGDKFELTGRIPAATSLDYPIKLASRSGGKAKIVTRFAGYEPCADEHGVETPYRGVSPLDRAKFILQARGALSG